MDELLEAFRDEAAESLHEWERLCFALEKGINTDDANSLYRLAHNLKGASAALDLKEFRDLVHGLEDVIRKLKYEGAEDVGEAVKVLLEGHTVLADWVQNLDQPGYAPVERLAVLTRCREVLGSSASESTPVISGPDLRGSQAGSESPKTSAERPKTADSSRGSSIRVSSEKLKRLTQLLGEVVIHHQMMNFHYRSGAAAQDYFNVSDQLGRLLKELSFEVDTFQTVTLEGAFQRAARAARDAADTLGKKIELELSGQETLVDKSVMERIIDPITHLIRNSVDHGLEDAAGRERAGKSVVGRIRLAAEMDLDCLHIRIGDDGQGINYERVWSKALDLGWVAPGEKPTPEQLNAFLFRPGFSTAKSVTEVSGRGVGLDVVHKVIEELRGTITIESERGRGTLWTLTLPLNVNLVQGLVIQSGSGRFVVPVALVEDIVSSRGEDLMSIEGRTYFEWRGRRVHLAELGDWTGNSERSVAAERVIVTRRADRYLGIRVERILSRQDCVVRPLEKFMASGSGFVGQTILGDGSPCFIIDPRQLFEEAS